MTARARELEANIDRFLAMATPPAVPSDLARRIVVRTAYLTQAGGVMQQPPVALQKPVILAPRRRVPSLGWAWGGAIAACLVLLVAGGTPDDLPPDARRAPDRLEMASARGPVEAAATPFRPTGASVPAAPPDQAPQLAMAGPGAAPDVPRTPAADQAPRALPGEAATSAEDVAAAVAATDPAGAQSALPMETDAFVLAENKASPREPVYGPILEPNEYRAAAGFGGQPKATSGMAIAPALPRGAPPAGTGRR